MLECSREKVQVALHKLIPGCLFALLIKTKRTYKQTF